VIMIIQIVPLIMLSFDNNNLCQTFIFVIFIVEGNYHLPTKVVKENFCVWMLLLSQANGCTCVDFGCTHPIDGLFWSLPNYLSGFFSKYECWVTNLIMLLYHFIFMGCHLRFCIMRFHFTMKCKKKFIWLILKWNLFDKHTNNYLQFLQILFK
jgi:hypothetical protein